jgi:hypothetical protein
MQETTNVTEQTGQLHHLCFTCEYPKSSYEQPTSSSCNNVSNPNDRGTQEFPDVIEEDLHCGTIEPLSKIILPPGVADKYCINCSMFTCADCTLPGKRHFGHHLDDIEQSFELFVSKIIDRLETLTHTYQVELESLNKFAGVALKVADVTSSFVSQLNAKLNGLINTIEEIRTNLVMATLQNAQTQQAQAAKQMHIRKCGHINWERNVDKMMLNRCSAATTIQYETVRFWANKDMPSGNLEVVDPDAACFEIPADLKDIVETPLKPVRQELKEALSTVEYYAGYSVSYNFTIVLMLCT